MNGGSAMTESDYTRQVIRALRQRLPHGVTFKHADLFTMGVPDFTVTVKRCTNWLEGKKLGPETVTDGFVILRPARHVPAVQWETLRRLGRGHLVIYTDYGHAITHVKGLRESVT